MDKIIKPGRGKRNNNCTHYFIIDGRDRILTIVNNKYLTFNLIIFKLKMVFLK